MFHCIAASIGVAFQNMTNNPDQKNVILLLTRPEGGNERFCLNIEHLLGQCEILDNPLQKIEFLETISSAIDEAFEIPINGLAWPDVRVPSSNIATTSEGRVNKRNVLLI